MSINKSKRYYAILAVSFALGAIFIYAGIDKIRNPLQFADSIAAFAILSPVLINPLAMGLPIFEILCGLLLQIPPARRLAALAIGLLSIVFFCVLLSALLRGLTIDCGCFGAGAPSRTRMWQELGLNVLLIGGAVFIYCRPNQPPRPRPA